MIIQDKWGNVMYVDEDVVQKGDEMGMFGAVDPEMSDAVGFENFFHSVPKEQLEVMICLYLGMKPKEIAIAFGYKNVARFYNISSRLRKTFNEGKATFIS